MLVCAVYAYLYIHTWLDHQQGGKSTAMTFAAKLKIFKRATSLGGVESLVEHR
jgi:hypothetical protein